MAVGDVEPASHYTLKADPNCCSWQHYIRLSINSLYMTHRFRNHARWATSTVKFINISLLIYANPETRYPKQPGPLYSCLICSEEHLQLITTITSHAIHLTSLL